MLPEGFFGNGNHVPKGKLNTHSLNALHLPREFSCTADFFPKGEGRGRPLLLQGAI